MLIAGKVASMVLVFGDVACSDLTHCALGVEVLGPVENASETCPCDSVTRAVESPHIFIDIHKAVLVRVVENSQCSPFVDRQWVLPLKH